MRGEMNSLSEGLHMLRCTKVNRFSKMDKKMTFYLAIIRSQVRWRNLSAQFVGTHLPVWAQLELSFGVKHEHPLVIAMVTE